MIPGSPARLPLLVLALSFMVYVSPCLSGEGNTTRLTPGKEKDSCSQELAHTLFLEAGQHFAASGFMEAERAYQHAGSCFRKIPGQDSLVYLCLMGEAMCLFRQDRLEAARIKYHELLDIQQNNTVIPSELKASVLHNLGLIYQQQFDFQHALEYQKRAAESKESGQGSPGFKGSAWNNLGALHEQCGSPPDALSCYEKALRYFLEEADHEKLMTIYLNLARLQQARGRSPEARMYLDAALLHARQAGNPDPALRHELVYSLAVKHYQQANYQAALDNCREIKAMQHLQPLAQRIRETSLEACCLEKLNRFTEADTLFARDFPVDAAHGNELSALASHLMARAMYLHRRNQPGAALRNMQAAVDAFENAYGQDAAAVLYARMQLADLCYQQKNYKKAWQESRQALDRVLRHEDQYYPPLCIDLKELKALSAFALYEEQPDQTGWLEESMKLYSDLSHDLVRIRMSMPEETSRESGNEYKPLLENGIKIGWLAWQEHLPGSLQHLQELMQSNRALSLRQQWQERSITASLPMSDPVLIRYRETGRKLKQHHYDIGLELAKSSPDFDLLAGLEESYLASLRQMDSLRVRLSVQYPVFDTGLPDPGHQQREYLLRDSTVCLAGYFFGRDVIAVLLRAADMEDVILWNIDSACRSTLQHYLADIRMVAPDTWQHHSRETCRMVFDPLLESLRDYRHLILMPDAELWTLPFDALILPPDFSDNPRKESFLIERWSLEIAYSGTNLISENTGFSAVSMHVPDTSLVYAEKEAETLRKLCLDNGLPFSLATGSKSAPDRFLGDVAGSGIVHLSTHARGDLRNPSRSVLGFAGNGLLSENEIYQHSVGTPLLILNACETQKGPVDLTEGMLSLAHAFLSRGAKQLIAGLWRIQDEAASRIMISFYTALLKGVEVPRALQMAKIGMLRQPDTRFPRNWAAWQLLRP